MSYQIHKKIGSISFSLFSPKQITDLAAAKVVTPELYDREGYPVDGGLMDIRLGVIDPGLRCKTCGGKLKECPGHFGYIELARPVIHAKFVRQIFDLLKSSCKYCGRFLIQEGAIKKYLSTIEKSDEEENIDIRRRKLRDIVAKHKVKDKCPHCDKKQETIKLEKPYNFYENEVRLSPIEIRARLEKIPDEDLPLFGLTAPGIRPEWMILTALQIPP